MQTTLVDGKRIVKSTTADRNAVQKALDVFDFVGMCHQNPEIRAKAAAALEAGQAIQKELAATASASDDEPAFAPKPAAPPAKEDKKNKAEASAATAK
jgi:hypothetical protein